VEGTIGLVEEKKIQKMRTTARRLVVFAGAVQVVAVAGVVEVAAVAAVTEGLCQAEHLGCEALESGLALVACPELGNSWHSVPQDGEGEAHRAVDQAEAATRRQASPGDHLEDNEGL